MALKLSQRVKELRFRLSSVNNLSKNKTAGDMKFYIFDYDPRDELRIRDEVNKAVNSNPEIDVFDLYEMMIDIIKENGYFETIINMEKEYGKTLLLQEVFQPMLALEQSDSPILNRFKNTVPDDGKHIVLITGVGKSYPIIRSHTVLNNHQETYLKQSSYLIYQEHSLLEKDT